MFPSEILRNIIKLLQLLSRGFKSSFSLNPSEDKMNNPINDCNSTPIIVLVVALLICLTLTLMLAFSPGVKSLIFLILEK